MTIRVKIYQPTKNAMQSGRARTKKWHLVPEVDTPLVPDRLMGWQSGVDTLRQINLVFDTQAEAVAYAKRKGYEYRMIEPNVRSFKHKSYASNFTKPPLV